MNLVVSHEQRFERTPDGAVWTRGAGRDAFWARYLDVFEDVTVVARLQAVSSAPPGAHRADRARVSFAAVPFYVGPLQYLRRRGAVRRAARRAVAGPDAVILRVPGQIASCVEAAVGTGGRPYAVEVVGDPHDVFAPGAVRHPLRPWFRRRFTEATRRQCAGACAAAYVTATTLQRRYPCPGFSSAVSDVELPPFAQRREPPAAGRPVTVVTVASMDQMYKAPDVLIDAVAICVRAGIPLQLLLVGDGRHRAELESRVRARGLDGRARFVGMVPSGAAVTAHLDASDLFVLPSRTEGLPRAMIEAMSRGLPCIGSTAGGIPELLPPEDLVPPGDAEALARKIREVMADPGRMVRMSARNLDKAGDFRAELLRERRTAFLTRLRSATEEWLRAGGRP